MLLFGIRLSIYSVNNKLGFSHNKWIYLSSDVVQRKSELTSISAVYSYPALCFPNNSLINDNI